jgi:hypothetical protein
LALPLQHSPPLQRRGGCRNRRRNSGGLRLVVHSTVLLPISAAIVCIASSVITAITCPVANVADPGRPASS